MKVGEKKKKQLQSWAHFMGEVVSVQVVLRNQSCSLHSSLEVCMEADSEDRLWIIKDKRSVSTSGLVNSLLHCCCTEPSGGNPGERALFCIPRGPVNLVSGDDGK